MKKFAFITGWVAILLINIWYLYDSFEYFSKNLTDLIYVFAIAIAGGISFWIYGKCSPKFQRRIQLILMGILAIACSLTCIVVLFVAIQLLYYPFVNEVRLYLVAVSAFTVILTVLFWWKFYHILKDHQ